MKHSEVSNWLLLRGFHKVSAEDINSKDFTFFISGDDGEVKGYIGLRFLPRGRRYALCVGFNSDIVWNRVLLAATSFGNEKISTVLHSMTLGQPNAKGFWPVFLQSFSHYSGFSVQADLKSQGFLTEFDSLVFDVRSINSLGKLFEVYVSNVGHWNWRMYSPSAFLLLIQLCALSVFMNGGSDLVLRACRNWIDSMGLSSDAYARAIERELALEFLEFLISFRAGI